MSKLNDMNAKLLLLSAFTLLYIFVAQWWYSNKVAGVCCGPEKVVVPEVPEAKAYPLAFEWQKPEPLLGRDFAAYKTNTILQGMKEDNILQITGLYHEEEEAPEGYDNMGLARAAAVREVLKDDISSERVDISSRLADSTATMKEQPFEGASFNWRDPLVREETTIVTSENEITIYFPFNSTVRDRNPQVDEYLRQLAERLKQSNERVAITGHTDNVGEEEANVQLGLRRAESIRDILVRSGISKDRITIDSKGERQPATSNATEEGRHRNRRTVLRIIS